MSLFKLIVLLNIVNLSIELSHVELHCNFSKYILNFFKHHEKYLLYLEKQNSIFPVTHEDLKTYGTSLKTHGRIIMGMLDALRINGKESKANDLMSVNLYLNNVSESLNFIVRNSAGKYDRNLSSVLKGYQLFHRVMVNALEEFINKSCNNVTVDEDFIKCPDYNTSGKYNIKYLPEVSEKLINRLLNKNLFKIDPNNLVPLLNKNEVFISLSTSLNSKNYKDYDPKNLLFYDLLTPNNTESKIQHLSDIQKNEPSIMVNEKSLDLLKYAKVKVRHNGKNMLNITDVVRYMLFSFDTQNMISFQELVMAASILPLLSILQTFCLFIKNSPKENNKVKCYSEDVDFSRIIKVGEEILKNSVLFNNYNIFVGGPKKILIKIIETFEKFISQIKLNKKLHFSSLQLILNLTSSFLNGNRLDHSLYSVSTQDLKEINFKDQFSQIKQFSNRVTNYTTALKKYVPLFKTVQRTYFFGVLFVLKNKNFIDDSIEYILKQYNYCNLYDNYKKNIDETESSVEIDKNDDFVFDVEDVVVDLYTEIVDNKYTTNKKCEYALNAKPRDQFKSMPKYIKDYLLFD